MTTSWWPSKSNTNTQLLLRPMIYYNGYNGLQALFITSSSATTHANALRFLFLVNCCQNAKQFFFYFSFAFSFLLFYLKGSNGDKCAEGRIESAHTHSLSIHFAETISSTATHSCATNREWTVKYPKWRNNITTANGQKCGKWQDINWIHWPFSTWKKHNTNGRHRTWVYIYMVYVCALSRRRLLRPSTVKGRKINSAEKKKKEYRNGETR